ncbi:MAG TPA: hypothetical protein G4O11_00840 [Anaerolineae bacterium]|nr:hypothetical protein [Anaerolineae bacterium]
MRHRAYLIAIIIILFCFSLGILSTLVNRDRETTITPTPKPSPSPDQTRRTLLILGIDTFDEPAPTLMAIWYIIHRIPEGEVVLFGVPVDHRINASEAVTLRSIFSYTVEEGISEDFMDGLAKAVPHIRQNYWAIMDETFFEALVDFVGGVPVGDRNLSGMDVVSVQRLMKDNPDVLLQFQAEMLSSLRSPVLMFDPTTVQVGPLWDMIPENCVLSEEKAQLLFIARQVSPLTEDAIRIELMPSVGD